MKSKFLLVFTTLILAQSFCASGQRLVQKTVKSTLNAHFYHGVASGDPREHEVVLWTRISSNGNEDAEVTWEVSTTTDFAVITTYGNATATSANDFTIKVLAENLNSGQWYYYRFKAFDVYSPIGRTRTAPEGGVSNLRLAVMACANYQDGYFNAYRDVVNRNDVDAVLHLGDYIYEYGLTDFSPGSDTSRQHEPDYEILDLNDYRHRHAHYKLDPDLQELHRQFPFISIWDDHESANNSWVGGAENHSPATEGDWEQRVSAAKQAYFEWMPILPSNQSIYRSFNWGNLLKLVMLDTRLEGREEQAGTSGAVVNDTNRTLLGDQQLNWFLNELDNTQAQWKIMGNQVMISPLRIFSQAVNEDQWDGYPLERLAILSHIDENTIDNCVFLTGDIHTSWANDLPVDFVSYTASTGQGSVAVEYVCTSVSSSSIFDFELAEGLIQLFNPNVKYAELTSRGYLLFDVNTERVQGDWVYVSTVSSTDFTSSVNASWVCNDLENHLEAAGLPLEPRFTNPDLAPEAAPTVVAEASTPAPSIIACYPNPFSNYLKFQMYNSSGAPLEITLYDLSGRPLVSTCIEQGPGIIEGKIDTESIRSSTFILSVSDGKSHIEQRVVKQ